VLEKVRDTGDAGSLISRPDTEEQVHRNVGDTVVFLNKDFQTVVQRKRRDFEALGLKESREEQDKQRAGPHHSRLPARSRDDAREKTVTLAAQFIRGALAIGKAVYSIREYRL
jgi:hypothetical protein